MGTGDEAPAPEEPSAPAAAGEAVPGASPVERLIPWSPGIEKPLQYREVLLLLDEFLYRGEVYDFTIAQQSFQRIAASLGAEDLDAIIPPCLEVLEMGNRYIRNDTLLCVLHVSMGCMTPDAPLKDLGLAMRRHAALLVKRSAKTRRQDILDQRSLRALAAASVQPPTATVAPPSVSRGPLTVVLFEMVKVTVGKAEDPWCEIELTEEDVEDWKKGVDITEEKFKEVIQLPPITLENCHEREDGDLQWDEITFEEEVNGKYWHAVIMALHRIREDFVKKQRKMKHLDWYMTMKKTSDKRNAKYYV